MASSFSGRLLPSGLGLDYICSTHGPVWHERISEVVALYDNLSAYRSEPV